MAERKKSKVWVPLAFVGFVAMIAVVAFLILLNKDSITEPLPEGGPTVSPR